MTPITRQPESSPDAGSLRRRASDRGGYGVVVVASSTGGPEALTHLLPHWDLDVPVLIVQHMPAEFTKSLAERLNRVCPMPVAEARDGEPVVPGRVLIAPGDVHLRVRGAPSEAEVFLTRGPLVHSLRPAADLTFCDVAEVWGHDVLALVLTGMGRDAVEGARAVVATGGMVLAQDEATSTVWGMPHAVIDAGLATAVLPLDRFATTVPTLCRSGVVPSDAFEAPEVVAIPAQTSKDPFAVVPFF